MADTTAGIRPEYRQKPVRSYVIRGGRITEAQKRAFDRVWARYGLSLSDGRIDPLALFGREAPLVLEVGFGMGDSLLAMARAEPDKDFIGIEVYPPGVGRLLNNAHQLKLDNLRVFMADGMDVLQDCIPDDRLQRFQLYFPDPWHKKKHHKRRLVQPEFMQTVRAKLMLGGICHLATDWEPYAEQMMAVMTLAQGFSNQVDEYCFAPRPDYRPLTKFERRGRKLHHGIRDLLFERTG